MPAVTSFSRPIPRTAGGRLSLLSGDPLPSADQLAKTQVKYTPGIGLTESADYISLYDGYSWKDYQYSELSLNVGSDVFQIRDVFAYLNAGTPALAEVLWNRPSGTITSCTNASPVVLTVASGHGVAVGDVIAVNGMATATAINGHTYKVTAVGTTTITLGDSQANGAGTGGNWYLVNDVSLTSMRATAIAQHSGIDVKSGDPTYRWVGTYGTGNVSGQTEDSKAKRLVWNRYNKQPRAIAQSLASNTYSPVQNSWTMTDKSVSRHGMSVYLVLGAKLPASNIGNGRGGTGSSGGSTNYACGVGIDDSTVNLAAIFGMTILSDQSQIWCRSQYDGNIDEGYKAIRDISFRTSVQIPSIYGDANVPTVVATGLHGSVEI